MIREHPSPSAPKHSLPLMRTCYPLPQGERSIGGAALPRSCCDVKFSCRCAKFAQQCDMPHATPPPKHRQFASLMRFDSTKAEEMLWQQIKNRQIAKRKFRRQVPLKGFIVDFVCFEAKLVIEVDGSQHAENDRDGRRDTVLTGGDRARSCGPTDCIGARNNGSMTPTPPLTPPFEKTAAIASRRAAGESPPFSFCPELGNAKASRPRISDHMTDQLNALVQAAGQAANAGRWDEAGSTVATSLMEKMLI
eukprot:gene84-123_t